VTLRHRVAEPCPSPRVPRLHCCSPTPAGRDLVGTMHTMSGREAAAYSVSMKVVHVAWGTFRLLLLFFCSGLLLSDSSSSPLLPVVLAAQQYCFHADFHPPCFQPTPPDPPPHYVFGVNCATEPVTWALNNADPYVIMIQPNPDWQACMFDIGGGNNGQLVLADGTTCEFGTGGACHVNVAPMNPGKRSTQQSAHPQRVGTLDTAA
jgi:hypothetical protein